MTTVTTKGYSPYSGLSTAQFSSYVNEYRTLKEKKATLEADLAKAKASLATVEATIKKMKANHAINSDYYNMLRQQSGILRSIDSLERELANVKSRMSAIEAELKKYGVTIC